MVDRSSEIWKVPLDGTSLLSKTNWRRAVQDAARELPADIGLAVGDTLLWKNGLTIQSRGNLRPTNKEPLLRSVVVTWWDSLHKELDRLAAASPGYGLENLYAPDDPRLKWPVISIERESSSVTEGVFPERCLVAHLRRKVQTAILAEMWKAGKSEVVFKDQRGRFLRRDGSLILAWQRASDSLLPAEYSPLRLVRHSCTESAHGHLDLYP
jgi:hypothetical protein